MSKPWSPPPDYERYKNEALSRAMWEYALRDVEWWDHISKLYYGPSKPPTQWQRLKWHVTDFIDRWMPRVHLRACNHDDCE